MPSAIRKGMKVKCRGFGNTTCEVKNVRGNLVKVKPSTSKSSAFVPKSFIKRKKK